MTFTFRNVFAKHASTILLVLGILVLIALAVFAVKRVKGASNSRLIFGDSNGPEALCKIRLGPTGDQYVFNTTEDDCEQALKVRYQGNDQTCHVIPLTVLINGGKEIVFKGTFDDCKNWVSMTWNDSVILPPPSSQGRKVVRDDDPTGACYTKNLAVNDCWENVHKSACPPGRFMGFTAGVDCRGFN